MKTKPTLKKFEDTKQFWSEISPHLRTEEAKNSLCLGLSHHFQEDPSGCLYQAAILDDDSKVLGAVVVSKYLVYRNLLPSPVTNSDHAKQLFEAVDQAGVDINGVVGELNTANLYRDLIHRSGKQTKTHVTQGIYRCNRVKMPSIPKEIKFRRAETHDMETIGKWIEAFSSEALPHDPPVNGKDIAESKMKSDLIYVLEKNGELLSMAAYGRDIGTSCAVNYVFTPKPSRKNGYGSIVTGLLTQKLLDNGKKETNLYTDMSNPTSNKIYQNLGYEFVCDSIHFVVR